MAHKIFEIHYIGCGPDGYRKEDQPGVVTKMKCATQQELHRLAAAGYINPLFLKRT
jgi:hypothetical protein